MTKLTPHPEQEEAITLALNQIGTSNGCLIGDEMGYGKTLTGTEFILRAIAQHGWTRILLVALPTTHKQWVNCFTEQSDGAVIPRVMNGTTKAGRENFEAFMKHEPGVYIGGSHFLVEKDWETHSVVDDAGNPIFQKNKKTGQLKLGKDGEPLQETKSVRKYVYYNRLRAHPLDAIIVDEAHVFANKKSNHRTTFGGMKAGYRMAMSGTWFLNKPENMWTVAKWVWPGEDPETGWPYIESSHTEWKNRYLKQEVVYGKSGRALTTARGATILKVTGERDPGEFVRTLPAYRRLENEDRPPKPEVVYVDPTPEQKAQMEDLEADLMTWVTDWQGNEAPLVVDLPMTLRMRLRQVAIAELSLDVDPKTGEERVYFADDAASAKLLPLRNLIDGPFAGQPVGVFTDSKIGALFLEKRMRNAGYDARAWTGDLTPTRREDLKQAFMAGEFPYLISTIQSMGVGIDGLQTVCNKVIWISEADGNPALNEQALARYFRPGRTTQNGNFAHVKLLMRGSVDEESFESLIDKAWRVRTAMNGGRAA